MKLLHVVPLAVLALAWSLRSAVADDGAVEHVGGAVRLLDHPGGVRMVSERVRAHVSRDSVDVDCVFEFVNSGAADTVLMGFPDRSYGDGNGNLPAMATFRSWVDDVEVPCAVAHDAEHRDPEETRLWWTRSVTFAADQRRIVHDRYRAAPGSSVDGTQWFTYILETGASWAGTIEDAEIVVTLVGLSPRWFSGMEPKPAVRGHDLIWRFHDFEPGKDGAPRELTAAWLTPEARARWKALNRETP